jgi:hypothetical protein
LGQEKLPRTGGCGRANDTWVGLDPGTIEKELAGPHALQRLPGRRLAPAPMLTICKPISSRRRTAPPRGAGDKVSTDNFATKSCSATARTRKVGSLQVRLPDGRRGAPREGEPRIVWEKAVGGRERIGRVEARYPRSSDAPAR